MLRIQLFGSFQITDDEKPLTRLQSERLQALLAYLVLRRDQPLSRQQLAVTFWPDTTDAQARTNLRTLMARLREALPEAERCLTVDAQSLQWRSDAPCAIDVIEFEQAFAAIAWLRPSPCIAAICCPVATTIGSPANVSDCGGNFSALWID